MFPCGRSSVIFRTGEGVGDQMGQGFLSGYTDDVPYTTGEVKSDTYIHRLLDDSGNGQTTTYRTRSGKCIGIPSLRRVLSSYFVSSNTVKLQNNGRCTFS